MFYIILQDIMYKTIYIFCFIISILNLKSFGQTKDTIILFNDQILVGKVEVASLGSITIDDNVLKLQY